MKQTDRDPNAKLSFMERLGYGMGDYAGNLVYSAISAFLLVYYTNVIGASAAAAAGIIAVSKIFDGISDLVMGYIVDHTRSKWGKARPWIARLCVPLAVCTVLMFSVPAGLEGKARLVYMFLTYNLVSTIFYTGINIPYATMHGLMTTNQYERGLLGNFRNLLATAGTMTINTAVLKMTAYFGGGDKYNRKGWTVTVLILMLVFIIINMFTFAVCTERVAENKSIHNQEEKVSFLKGMKGLLVNKYWILLVIAIFSLYFMMSCFFGSAVYFAQYRLGDANYFTPVSNFLSMSQIITLLITPFLMKKFTKRQLMLTGMSIASLGFALTGVSYNLTFITAMSVIKGIGFGFSGACMFGLLQDAITYGEWYSGYGTAGMGNAASSFCMKVGSGIGTAALGWILAAGGFHAEDMIQSAASLAAIDWAFIWIPAITMGIGVVSIALFDLDKKYDRVIADLSAGRHRTDG
ncbi:MFS transporter [Clostridium sp. Marseille-P2415]|uniref:MFS transporter n=1 Tax=Clostridium sp. Marseille-P2415 TaxID=1805471 RepID=UPI0013562E54|nr:glycoside-pentoside-hexuronide (GPH):cation symporter [Clostridium sp. Marseille-P2415]